MLRPIAFATLLLPLYAPAQWTTNTALNTLVAGSSTQDMMALGTDDGRTCVVFWHPVAAPTNYELRLQVLDAGGVQTLGPDGVLISDAVPMSTFTVIWDVALGTNDALYVAVTGTGGGEPVHVFRMDLNGTQDWGGAGVVVGAGYSPTLLPMANGDLLVGWASTATNLLTMQRLDPSGSPVWPGTQTLAQGGSTSPGEFHELTNGHFIAVFHSIGFGINSTLYAQRCDADGVAQWAQPTQLSDRATQFNRRYSSTVDGDVVYFGYFGATGNRFDSYLQRINADGTLPWGLNGMDFDTGQTDYEMDTRIAQEAGTAHVWAICTYTDPNQSQYGEYVQKFDKATGARLFTDDAKVVFPISAEDSVHVGDLALVNSAPSLLLKTGFDNGATPTQLGAVYLDGNGDLLLPGRVAPLATFPANKGRVHWTRPSNAQQQVAVFVEDKGSGDQVFAQRFQDPATGMAHGATPSGTVLGNPVRDVLQVRDTKRIGWITVQDLHGRLMVRRQVGGTSITLPQAQSWPAGTYILTVEHEDGTREVRRVVKQ